MKTEDSGFMTALFRSYNEDLSKDIYAKLWQTEARNNLANDYLKAISLEEVNAHSLRNRYFLETLKTLIKNKKIAAVINFGSGFSMYPFLLESSIINIEIDKPEVVDYKKTKILQWQNEGIIPEREVHFIGVDFSTSYEEELQSQILSIINNKPSLILLEGVLFFLSMASCNKLFRFFDSIQNPKDFIGSVSFNDSVKKTTAFNNLLNYSIANGIKISASDCLSLEDSYYENLKGYQLKDRQDYYSLSKTYNNIIKLEKDLILNEVFYLLQKK